MLSIKSIASLGVFILILPLTEPSKSCLDCGLNLSMNMLSYIGSQKPWVGVFCNKPLNSGSNDFQDYFDDAKESRVKQVPKNQESKSFKNQVSKNQDSRTIKFKDSIKFQEWRFKNNQDQGSRLKIQESREDSIKISTKKVFQNIE